MAAMPFPCNGVYVFPRAHLCNRISAVDVVNCPNKCSSWTCELFSLQQYTTEGSFINDVTHISTFVNSLSSLLCDEISEWSLLRFTISCHCDVIPMDAKVAAVLVQGLEGGDVRSSFNDLVNPLDGLHHAVPLVLQQNRSG